jgi:hypothetical protein
MLAGKRGLQAFKREMPDAVARSCDSGHFALETDVTEVAAALGDLRRS